MWKMRNNNYAKQFGRREFYSTLNGAPTYTHIHTLASRNTYKSYNIQPAEPKPNQGY